MKAHKYIAIGLLGLATAAGCSRDSNTHYAKAPKDSAVVDSTNMITLPDGYKFPGNSLIQFRGYYIHEMDIDLLSVTNDLYNKNTTPEEIRNGNYIPSTSDNVKDSTSSGLLKILSNDKGILSHKRLVNEYDSLMNQSN